tara:strand:- start:1080 stop:1382 length:303 start_codon:yes stop_codon:yes gene_type:complete
MGLTIASYPVYNGLTNITDAYLNIRNLRTTKEIRDTVDNSRLIEYTIEFDYVIQKSGTVILHSMKRNTESTPYTSNIWDTAYTLMKADLTSQSVTFTDNL